MILQSSLLILPPPEVQAFAAPLREKYTPVSFVQGPAHITLFYPFVVPKAVDNAIKILKSKCRLVKPFEITLDRYERFETAHFLTPADPEPIVSLYNYLFTEFPDYPAYDGIYGSNLIPHLTLASFENKEEADQLQLPPPPNFTFSVEQLYLFVGPMDERIPWIPISIIPLGHRL